MALEEGGGLPYALAVTVVAVAVAGLAYWAFNSM